MANKTAISNQTVPAAVYAVDSKGLPIGAPLADATLTGDGSVTIVAGATPGTFEFTLNDGAGVTTSTLAAVDPASGQAATATETWTPGPQAGIGIVFGTPLDLAPGEAPGNSAVNGVVISGG